LLEPPNKRYPTFTPLVLITSGKNRYYNSIWYYEHPSRLYLTPHNKYIYRECGEEICQERRRAFQPSSPGISPWTDGILYGGGRRMRVKPLKISFFWLLQLFSHAFWAIFFGGTISVKDNVPQRKKLTVGALPPSEQDGYYVIRLPSPRAYHVVPVLLARWQRSHI